PDRKWLLAEHVFSRLDRSRRDLTMCPIRRTDENGITAVKQFFTRRANDAADRPGRILGPLGNYVVECGDLGAVITRINASVNIADIACADYSDLDSAHFPAEPRTLCLPISSTRSVASFARRATSYGSCSQYSG